MTTRPNTTAGVSPAAAMFDLLATAWVPHAIHAATVLGIADVLTAGPADAADVAQAVATDETATARLLRALVTIGLVRHEPDSTYALTDIGALLATDAPGSLRHPVLLGGSDAAQRAWGQFVDCVRTGRTAASLLDGTDDAFAAYTTDPDAQATFDTAMAEATRHIAGPINNVYPFPDTGTIIDIGGGHGTLLTTILNARPHLAGVVVDRDHCRPGAETTIAAADLTDRYRFVAADFFTDDLPPADIAVLKSVLHDWDDNRSTTLLANLRRTMPPHGRLLIIEAVIPDQLEPTSAHRRMIWADLRMLIATGGRERTRAEYNTLLTATGFRLATITPTGAGLDIIEATPT
jgi:cyclopropane fatty-acyl-phospholipid synthase-like methyltransferase